MPLAAFAAAAFPLSGWLVDDAGISFAYARNLATGAGLVSQPGRIPVEGFSNPLWTLLFVPGFWLSASAPVWFAKFLGHLFALGAFFFGFRIVLRLTQSTLAGALAMMFLATNPAFVIWSVSGLENALYAFEIMALAWTCLLSLERSSWRSAVAAGLLAAAAALTRPDGVIFALLWPAAFFLGVVRDRRLSAAALRAGAVYLVAAALPFVAYKSFALIYFGSLSPNTYYAKGGPSLDTVLKILSLEETFISKGAELLAAPFGFAGLALGLFLVTLVISLFATQARSPLTFLAGASLLALVGFVLLPTDPMGEFRFGTPFLALFYPALFSVIWIAGNSLPRPRMISRQFPALVVIAVLAIAAIFSHQVRFARFYDHPTVPFAEISDKFGLRFNAAADFLGVEQASFLLPDLGGTLFYSELEIFDLAGLTDSTIAHTLGKDRDALHKYIFEEIKPTFIHTHEYWALASDLDSNPLFRKHYIPLREAVDPDAGAIAGRDILAGDYVRKDAVRGREALLRQMRKVLYAVP